MRSGPKLYLLTHKSSTSDKAQKLNFKIMSRCYRVPFLLNSLPMALWDCCWRCGDAELTMTHILWGCSQFQPFWSTVINFIKYITEVEIKNDPTSLLFMILICMSTIDCHKNNYPQEVPYKPQQSLTGLRKYSIFSTRKNWVHKIDSQSFPDLGRLAHFLLLTHIHHIIPFVINNTHLSH